MEKKDERAPKIPAGTFASSEPPPARRSDPGTGEGADRGSQPPDEGALRSRYTSTLMGVAVPPGSEPAPPAVAPVAPVSPVLAPPKWRGAKAYLEGQEPKPRVSAIPTHTPIVSPEAASTPSHVNTKLGPVAPPPPPFAPPLVPNAEAAIDQAIERMLEGQTAVPMEVEVAEPDEREQLEELPMDAAIPLDDPSERAVPLARVALKTTAARAPQAGVAPPAAAPQAPAARAADSGTVDTVSIPAPATAEAPSGARSAPEPAPRAAAELKPAEREAERARIDAQEAQRAVANAVSLPAPALDAGVSLPAAASPAQLVPYNHQLREFKGDPNLRNGLILLVAMVVVGAGGWGVTAGGFRRSVPPPSAVLPPKAAPVTEPLPQQAAPEPAPTTVAPAPATDPAASTATLPAAPARTTAETRPSASARTSAQRDTDSERTQPSAPQAAVKTGSDDKPVLRVVPKDAPSTATASETPTRQEVLDALEPLRPAVERCAHGQRGIAQLDITVVNTGVVTHAVVAGDFAGTPEGSCMALAARDAKFAPFQKPRFRVIFPFSL